MTLRHLLKCIFQLIEGEHFPIMGRTLEDADAFLLGQVRHEWLTTRCCFFGTSYRDTPPMSKYKYIY